MSAASGRWRATIVVLVAMAGLLVACGLPTDSNPRQIAEDKVPFSLLGPVSTNVADAGGGARATLYYLSGERLFGVRRALHDSSPAGVLTALVSGPVDSDPSGLRNAIPKATQVISAVVDGDTLVVTLSKDILTVGDPDQKIALAQLVWTLSEIGSSGVRFRVTQDNGETIDVTPTTDHGQATDALHATDFASLSPTNR